MKTDFWEKRRALMLTVSHGEPRLATTLLRGRPGGDFRFRTLGLFRRHLLGSLFRLGGGKDVVDGLAADAVGELVHLLGHPLAEVLGKSSHGHVAEGAHRSADRETLEP